MYVPVSFREGRHKRPRWCGRTELRTTHRANLGFVYVGFTFLHAADLHLGSPFTGLALRDAKLAERFANAGREAFSELVSRAIDLNIAFVVIAGDVYDGDWKDNSIGLFFNRQLARLDRAGIRTFLLKGNHDAESVITKSISLPDSVFQFPSGRAKTFQLEDLNQFAAVDCRSRTLGGRHGPSGRCF
jgi:DNA repair exonuclease SbcCD nuclease subunit